MEIRVDNIYKSFGPYRVFDGLSLTIPEGRITVILGGSGQGKSVLLKHIVGLLRPDRGAIYINGTDLAALKGKALDELRAQIGMVFQSGGLLNSLTVRENVALGLTEHGLAPPDEINRIVEEKLRIVHMEGTEDLRPAELSGGMRKRVSLARALTMNPKVILYDEPTAGLDPPTSDHIDEVIREMNQLFGVTSVVVTHDLVSVFRLAHQVCMMHGGRIILSGTLDDLRTSTDPVITRFLERISV